MMFNKKCSVKWDGANNPFDIGRFCEVAAIRAQKADYGLPVKGNQPTLAESVQRCFDRPFTAPTVAQTGDAEDGKVATRTCEFIQYTRKTGKRRRRRAISSLR
jgi:hypothetical protein